MLLAQVTTLFAQNRKDITPLLTAHWNQNAPYNAACPEIDGKKCYTGCVPVGIAQVLQYWKWPERGANDVAYVWKDSILVSKIGATRYDWSQIGDKIDSSSPENAIAPVAQLIYQCALTMNTNFEIRESGTGNVSSKLASVLHDFFGYSDEITVVGRKAGSKEEFEQAIYDELLEGRPCFYHGESVVGGSHFFVCDGYDAVTNKFHFNFGWGGRGDGYYDIDSIRPIDDPIMDAYFYSRNNYAYINVKPDKSFVPGEHIVYADSLMYQEKADGTAELCRILAKQDIILHESACFDGKYKNITSVASDLGLEKGYAFENVVLSKNIKTISYHAFAGRINGTLDMTKAKGLEVIEGSALSGNTTMRIVGSQIGYGKLRYIGDNAFLSSNLPDEILIDGDDCEIGQKAFQKSSVKSIKMNHVKALSNDCFATDALKRLELCEGITYLPYTGANHLDYLELPASLESCQGYDLPYNVNGIPYSTVTVCKRFLPIYVLREGALCDTLLVPAGSFNKYNVAQGWRHSACIKEMPGEGPVDAWEAIDLGLPSGNLWANKNIGANLIEDFGTYFAPENELDIPQELINDGWSVPTSADLQELCDKTSYEEGTKDYINGHYRYGINGNSIFIPAAGSRYESNVMNLNREPSIMGYNSQYINGKKKGYYQLYYGYLVQQVSSKMPVRLVKKAATSISDVASDSQLETTIYSVSGVKLANQSASNLPSGIYIIKNGKEAKKIVVK